MGDPDAEEPVNVNFVIGNPESYKKHHLLKIRI
jgi:hypothetical protein